MSDNKPKPIARRRCRFNWHRWTPWQPLTTDRGETVMRYCQACYTSQCEPVMDAVITTVGNSSAANSSGKGNSGV